MPTRASPAQRAELFESVAMKWRHIARRGGIESIGWARDRETYEWVEDVGAFEQDRPARLVTKPENMSDLS
jgi:hypothetical protein